MLVRIFTDKGRDVTAVVNIRFVDTVNRRVTTCTA